MTTTAKPAPKAKPAKHDLTHGPVAAAFNASVWPMMIAAIGKATGVIPPWGPLVAGTVLAGCLVLAGMHRKPRPLSRASLTYRAIVVLTAAIWLWFQLATFRDVSISTGQAGALLITWPAAVGLTVLTAVARTWPRWLRLALPGAPGLVAVVVTVLHLGAVTTWLDGALTVTDQFPPHTFAAWNWIGPAIVTLVVMAAGLAVLGVSFAHQERSADEELAAMERQMAAATPGGQAKMFLKLVSKLTGEYTEWRPENPYEAGRKIPNLKIVDVVVWKNGAGEGYILDLTGNEKGTTRTKLRAYTDDIATKMNLPAGCGVEILPARDAAGEELGAGFALVEISRVNVLKLEIPYPELKPRSIMNPLPLGRTRNDTEIGPALRESSAYLWGQKGSGKTVTISDVIAGAMQCTDCLVWVIDLNRGNAARPFLRAFADGTVDRPCIDWVATTVDEVVTMAEVGLSIALDRKSYYADLKFDMDTNLMPVGNGGPGEPPPEILIVIDEGATVLGVGGSTQSDEGRAAREALNQIMDLARDAAINIVFSGLRATSDVADTAFLRGTSVRIGMRVTDDAELALGFGDWKLSGKQISEKGSGYIRCGHGDTGDDIQVFKAYFLAPKRMARIGEECTKWRPYLDEQSLRTAGTRYANRWRRTARMLWDNPRPEVLNYGARPRPGGDGIIDGEVVDTPPRQPAPVSPSTNLAATGLTRPGAAGTGGGFDDMMQEAKRQAEARKQQQGGGAAPAPEPYQPPTGEPVADQPTAPASAETPATDQEFAAKFQDLAANMTVLDEDPERTWNRSGHITPDQEIAAAPADTRAILERLVKVAGPLRTKDLHAMLVAGGDWGPAVPISAQALHQLLKTPKSQGGGPVAWLAPRGLGEPYNHRDNMSG